MASIAKLSIRGVRSFSPNDDEQVIAFCFPLTIIVGANGCGKTTIIESLKYAVTGSLPPGNKSGQSFVHDPRSIGQTNVKASIKLRFNNTEGSSMVVARSMEVTQKKTSASFKALDGTIRTVNKETGERVTMSHKCSELDKNIPFFLGVSKPILEHVVFCHQEDSSWPLQEGAVLKKRFDDIFDSTRYAKALEAIKAERKSYASTAKDLKVELAGLNSHKHASTGFREELEDCKDKISGIEDKIKICDDDIEQERATGQEAQKVLAKIDEFTENLDYKRNDMETQEAVYEKQKELLGKDDLTEKHTYPELKEMLKELNDQRHGNEATRNLELKETECQDIERGIERLRRKANELNARKGKLEAERDAHSRVLRQRFQVMEEIHKKHKIELDGITQDDDDGTLTQSTATSRMSLSTIFTTNTNAITQGDMEAFQGVVDNKHIELKDMFTTAKKEHRVEEDAMQKAILELQAKKAAIDNDRKRNEASKTQAMRELNQISSQMSSSLSRVRKEHVEEAKHQAARLAKDRDEYNNHPRREEITKEIRVLEDRLKSISATIEQDNKIRDQLRLRADEQNEIDMLSRQATQEYDVLNDLLRENSFLITSQGEDIRVTKEDPTAPVGVVHNNVRNKLLNAQADVERCNSVVGDVQKKVSEKQALLGNHRQRFQQLQHKKTTLLCPEGGAQKIKSVIRAIVRFDKDTVDNEQINDDTSPSELLMYIAEQVKSYSKVEEKPENISKIVKRLKKMAKTEMHCPCCMKTFDSNDEILTFQSRMTELADPDVSELHAMASKNAQEVRGALDKYEIWRRTVSENMSEYLELGRVVSELTEVEGLINDEEGGGHGSLKDLESELETEEVTLTEKKEHMKELQILMTTVNGIQDAAKRVWEKMGNVKEKKEKLKYQFFGNVDDPRDLKTVEKDLTKSSDQKELAYTNINKLNNEQKQLNEMISRVTNQAATAERSAREKEDAYKRDQESTKRKDQLNNDLTKLTELDKELDKQIMPVRTHLMQKESDRDRMRDANAQEDGMLSNQLKDFERDMDKLKEVNDKIDQYVRSNKDNEIHEVDQKLLRNAEDISSGEGKLTEMKPELENLKKQVEDGDRQKKTIQDNLELFKLEKTLNQLQEEIKNLQDEVAAMGGDDAREKHQVAVTNIRQQQSKIERYNGRMQGLTEQKRNLRRKLNEPEYKGVDERQRTKMIEHETTNIVVTDLDKYYDALDKALLRYHGMKINDINKIIRELWTLTYKGEDITNIEIQSGQDSGARANRSYNYRIVMSKGSTQMDMRGRCSAGQRVLASIVIRLALAETFCLNCGVVALDEPTTNLDFENKRGLAIALGQIIASRAAQSNFQLVVITHDEDFVSMMKQELSSQTGFNMPERYYQVSREEGHDGRFYSKINAVDWDDL
mmetsp:Transcript_32482/g.56581  ORF Transcript_32482/g.56581 Transcript_32482/m.56581 type:complete len:1402 (+) Transcript_32482:134-4339(+)|eukprot:CAMPEP_0201904162 /NCGR_PEP_ID=MMETSP0902-20130614/55853_1 /ASSEMBLY_ACC=CAM_ASM_000551 /TAXON_ID=420261 /ORGANISM="Thalassiosira antarctica, Strain CCMP982" /LENGTH=1401 /DNA_ID=CAMNT_0048438241 /DNA_START=60 /DNA_END=4265 /DNA_ORIENTATION=-